MNGQNFPHSKTRLDSLSDETLYSLSSQGDQAAFRVLTERYVNKLWHVSMNILADAQEAEDVVQEVFISVWKQPGKWQQGEARFTTWLHRVTINKAIDFRRKRKEPPTPAEIIEAMIDNSDNVGVHVEVEQVQFGEAELSDNLKALINDLPESQRQALLLFYFDELKIHRIALTMNSTEQAVRSLLKRGRQTLRERISKQKKICVHDIGGI